MRGVEGKTGKNRFGFSYCLLPLAVLVYLGTWAYSAYAAEGRAKSEIPKIDPVLKIIKGLRQYQKIKATFSPGFNEIEATMWRHPTPPAYAFRRRSRNLHNHD